MILFMTYELQIFIISNVLEAKYLYNLHSNSLTDSLRHDIFLNK